MFLKIKSATTEVVAQKRKLRRRQTKLKEQKQYLCIYLVEFAFYQILK